MSMTERYREQHQELLQIAGEIDRALDPVALARDGGPARHLLSSFGGKLKVHLAMEDRALYPRLHESADPAVRATGDAFVKEMGGLLEVYKAYTAKWGNPLVIQADAGTFVDETRGLLAALGKRIDREDNVLYPLVDRLG